ncbi:D-alanine--D-alanine ligase [soil metagenome]
MGLFSGGHIRVAVLRGGASSHYDASLRTGEHVLNMLRLKPEIYEPMDIFISKDGTWHLGGVEKEPHQALMYADVIFNALHGEYGEDGQIQSLLSKLHIPFTGPDMVSSAITRNKHMSKTVYENHSILTPKYQVISEDDEVTKLIEIFRNYLHPIVVKPSSSDMMKGLVLAYTFEELVKAVDATLEYSKYVILEEFIRGKEARVGVVENARGENLYALIPLEAHTPHKNMRPDYDTKLSSPIEHKTSTGFTIEENKVLEDIAKRAHTALGLRHYSHSDIILTPRGRAYMLETTALPQFSKGTSFEASLQNAGWTSEAFVDHIIELAMKRARG